MRGFVAFTLIISSRVRGSSALSIFFQNFKIGRGQNPRREKTDDCLREVAKKTIWQKKAKRAETIFLAGLDRISLLF